MSPTKINRALTEALERVFSMRHCRSCRRERAIEGGHFKRTANGQNRWECGVCEKITQQAQQAKGAKGAKR